MRVDCSVFVLNNLVVNKRPQQINERLASFLHCDNDFRIVYEGFNFLSVPHNASIKHELVDFGGVESGNLRRVKIGEQAAVVLALVQNGYPAQIVVIVDVELAAQTPSTALVFGSSHTPIVHRRATQHNHLLLIQKSLAWNCLKK